MVFRTLRHEELGAWFSHCQGVFTLDDINYFRNHYQMDPFADVSLIFVAMDGDTIAATVRVFDRHAWIDGRSVRVGGIGEVSTKPEYRRRGLVSELLQMAIAEMAERGMAVSILFGDQPIYEKAGWRFCEAQFAEMDVGELPVSNQAGIVRPFEEADFPYLMGLYDLYMGRMDGAIIRDEAYWRNWVFPQWKNPLVLVREDRPVAYCCSERSKENARVLQISEFAVAPSFDDAVPKLFCFAAQRAEGIETITCPFPLLPHGFAHKVWSEPQYMMVRLNNSFEGTARTSDGLSLLMRHAGMCGVDHF